MFLNQSNIFFSSWWSSTLLYFFFFYIFVSSYSMNFWLLLFCSRLSLSKLDLYSLKCIFFGCSCTQKEYKCYSPDLHRYLVFVDVIYFESIPYFVSSKSSSFVTSLIPLMIIFLYLLSHKFLSPLQELVWFIYLLNMFILVGYRY